MFILCDIYQRIVNYASDYPPETGGILGGNENMISYVEFDDGMQQSNLHKCYYAPDVKKLNRCIENWSQKEIEFYGIFHTHYYGILSLSEGDKQYIFDIMKAMPIGKDSLYFPIVVLPQRRIIAYKGIRSGDEIQIVEDEVKII